MKALSTTINFNQCPRKYVKKKASKGSENAAEKVLKRIGGEDNYLKLIILKPEHNCPDRDVIDPRLS